MIIQIFHRLYNLRGNLYLIEENVGFFTRSETQFPEIGKDVIIIFLFENLSGSTLQL